MNQITIKIQGMSCGMCEAHINDTVRKVHPEAKKVASSHRKGETTFLLAGAPDSAALRRAIGETGYTFLSMESTPYRKKGLFSKK